MRKLLIGIILVLTIFLAGCTSERTLKDGKTYQCVGIDKAESVPEVVYKISKWNAFLGVIFIETIVVPLVVLADDFYCPVDIK